MSSRPRGASEHQSAEINQRSLISGRKAGCYFPPKHPNYHVDWMPFTQGLVYTDKHICTRGPIGVMTVIEAGPMTDNRAALWPAADKEGNGWKQISRSAHSSPQLKVLICEGCNAGRQGAISLPSRVCLIFPVPFQLVPQGHLRATIDV